jgi:two-component system chemotaxis response regulator CheB
MNRKIRVLIVDDSALVRKLMVEMISADPGIEVVGTAQDPYVARERIKSLCPDVLTLDVEMPRMDGITFLRNLMRLHPMPVVMVSSLTDKGAQVTLDALALGAVDFVSKPKLDLASTLNDYAAEIVAKIKMAAKSRVRPRADEPPAPPAAGPAPTKGHFRTTDRIIAIGASTGGTEAIKEVLMQLPADCPGIVISQHIPQAFSGPFARRMNSLSPMSVDEARDGQQIVPGHVYIAPGNHHLLVERDGARYICRLSQAPAVNRHRPSVDVMFRSVASNVGRNAMGVILTGMGSDGAQGLKEMREAGAWTVAQDEASSVVWGMPGEAVALDAAATVLPLERIAGALLNHIHETGQAGQVRQHGT